MLGLDSLSKPEEEQQPNIPKEETTPEGEVSQGDQPDETKNDVKQELPNGEGAADTSVERKTSQDDQPDETKNDAKQELPIEEATAGATIAENLVLDDQLTETINRVEPNVSTEEISTNGTSLKPLKKPKAAAPRPFRRQAKRDRTGGPPQKYEEND